MSVFIGEKLVSPPPPPPPQPQPPEQPPLIIFIPILDMLEGDVITYHSIDSTSPIRAAIGPFNEPILVRRVWIQDVGAGISDSYLLAWSKDNVVSRSILINGQILWQAPQFGKANVTGNPLTAPAILVGDSQGHYEFEIMRPVTAAPFYIKFEWTQYGIVGGRSYFMAMEIKYLNRPIQALLDVAGSLTTVP